jgi:hypothetical protein
MALRKLRWSSLADDFRTFVAGQGSEKAAFAHLIPGAMGI